MNTHQLGGLASLALFILVLLVIAVFILLQSPGARGAAPALDVFLLGVERN